MQYLNQDQNPGKNKLVGITDAFNYTLNILFSLPDIYCEYFSNLPLQSLQLVAPWEMTLPVLRNDIITQFLF